VLLAKLLWFYVKHLENILFFHLFLTIGGLTKELLDKFEQNRPVIPYERYLFEFSLHELDFSLVSKTIELLNISRRRNAEVITTVNISGDTYAPDRSETSTRYAAIAYIFSTFVFFQSVFPQYFLFCVE
jgi:hypothetical protein